MMATAPTSPDNSTVLLPVAQFTESHNLELDPDKLGINGATVVAPPYQAMSVGDVVTLSVDIFYGGVYFETLKRPRTLTAENIGEPVYWTVPKDALQQLQTGDHIEASYSIAYVTPTVATVSEKQTLHILEKTSPELLPRLSIKDFAGDTLDPDAYPDGITLSIELYAGIQVGDCVMLHAMGESRLVIAIYVDQTTIDSQTLHIPFGHAWLAANSGNEVSLMYEYARLGSAGASLTLPLMLRKPLNLPPPIIVGVTPDGPDDYQGFLLGQNALNGITILLPEEAVIGSNDKVQMVFDGFQPGGHYMADPDFGDPKTFKIPKHYVPANLGKRLYVFYEVTPPGEKAVKSRRYDLQIKNLTSGWPTLQITSPPGASNAEVSLKTVSDAVTVRLRAWVSMAEGQRLRIYAKGVLQAGDVEETFNVRVGATEVVTEDEYLEGEIQAKLPRTFLAKLKLNQQFNVTVDVSFDGGFSYKQLPMISPRLVE